MKELEIVITFRKTIIIILQLELFLFFQQRALEIEKKEMMKTSRQILERWLLL